MKQAEIKRMIIEAREFVKEQLDGQISIKENDQVGVSSIVGCLITASVRADGTEVVISIPEVDFDFDKSTFETTGKHHKLSFSYSSGGYLSIGRYGISAPVMSNSQEDNIITAVNSMNNARDTLHKFRHDVGLIEGFLLEFLSKNIDNNTLLMAICLYGLTYRYGGFMITLSLNTDDFMQSIEDIRNGDAEGLNVVPEFSFGTDAQVNILFKADDDKTLL